MAMATLAAGAGVHAAESQQVVMAFNISSEGPLVVRERGNSTLVRQDIIVERYSNREFLQEMVDEGLIDEVRGWSVVRVKDDVQGDLGMFVIRRGSSSIDVNDRLALESLSEPVEARVSLEVVSNGNTRSRETTLQRRIAGIRVTSADAEINGRGALSEFTASRNGEQFQSSASLDAVVGTFSSILGVGAGADGSGELAAAQPVDGNEDALVEGFVRFFRGQPFDLIID
jgi:hypothetical protein